MVDLDSPEQVAGELERRGLRPLVDGEVYATRSRDVVEVATALNVERWARLGGGQDGDVMTAELINRGRLVEAMQSEEEEESADDRSALAG